jgi:tetratricopeptide (TPR) repeat protein
MGDDLIIKELTGAVFRLQTSDSQSGTAYLIDGERGYLITAYHVVQGAFKTPSSVKITATSIALPDHALELETIKGLGLPQDVALLKVKDIGDLKNANIRPLDLATHFPPTTHYVTIGYPRGKNKPNSQSAELEGKYEGDETYKPDYYFEIKQDIDDGSSGSPLIDQNGAVIATCVAKVHNYSGGLYTPTSYIEDLLRSIPPDSRVQGLNEEFGKSKAASSKSVRGLIERLKWRSGNPSNLELYEWANQLTGGPDQSWVKSYISCPLLPAYGDRRLADTDAVLRLSSQASAAVRAKILTSAADQELLLGRYVSAKAKAEQAIVLYQKAGDRPGSFAAQTVVGRANLYLNNSEDAARVLTAVANSADVDQSARAKLYLAQAFTAGGDPYKASQMVQEVLPYWEHTGDKEGFAWSLQTLGEADLKKGDYQSAFVHASASRDECLTIGNGLCAAAAGYTLVNIEESRKRTKSPSSFRAFKLIPPWITLTIAAIVVISLLIGLIKIVNLIIKRWLHNN